MKKLMLAGLAAAMLNLGAGAGCAQPDEPTTYTQAEMNQLVANFLEELKTVERADFVEFLRGYPHLDLIKRELEQQSRIVSSGATASGKSTERASEGTCLRIMTLALANLDSNPSLSDFFYDSYQRNCM